MRRSISLQAELEGQTLAEKIGNLEVYQEKISKELAALQTRLDESVRVSDDIDRQRRVSDSSSVS